MDTPATDPRGVRHPDDVKERAYQLWAFQASRRVALVSDLLAAGEIGEPVAVPSRTISRWATDDGWPDRVARDLRAIAPDMREQTVGELIMGALGGARYLRAVAEGREPKPDRDRVTSSIALIDRAGLSHVGKSDPSATLSGGSSPARLASVAGLSDDDLDQLERQALAAKDRAPR